MICSIQKGPVINRMLLTTRVIACPHCGEANEIEVDRTAGAVQQFVEDCWVCCRPIDFRVTITAEGEIRLQVSRAY